MKKITFTIVFCGFVFAQSVEIKDDGNNTLMNINDEGKAGSLSLPAGESLIQTSSKLYNENGTLKWQGNELSTGPHTTNTNAQILCPDGYILTGSGACITIPSGAADNLGDHTATQNVQLNANWLSGDGDEEGIFVDSDGNVGIGFGSPTRALQVYDDGITYVNFQSSVTGTGADDGLEFTISGDNTAYIKNQEDASLILGANNNNHLTINNSGNVGIGTTNPNSLLSVGNNGLTTATIYGGMTDDNATAIYGNSSGSLGIGTYGQASGDNATGLYGYATHASGTVYGVKGKVNSSNGWAGYFDGRGYFSGRVGIGILNPGNKIHLHEPSSSFSYQKFTNTTTGTLSGDGVLIGIDPNEDFRVHSYEDNNLAFWINNDEKVRIANTGNVGIGEVNPEYKLDVRDNSGDTYVANIEATLVDDEDARVLRLGMNTLTAPGIPNPWISFFNNGSYYGAVEGDYSGGVNYYSASDARLKNDLGKNIEGLDIVSKMKVRKYEFKRSPGIEKIGFFAQELQEVYPDAVGGSSDSDVNTEPMMIDYGKLTPILVKAIQELQARVEELENK